MIPPLQPRRLRSIERWLKDQPNPPSDLSSRAAEIDDAMIQEFEDREDSLKAQMMRDKTWGTAEGLTSFPTARLMMWGEVVSEFLPPISEPNQEP